MLQTLLLVCIHEKSGSFSQVKQGSQISAGCKNCSCSFPAVGSSLQIQQAPVTLCLFFFGKIIKKLRFHMFPVHSLLHFPGENASQHSKLSLTTRKNITVQTVVLHNKKRTSFSILKIYLRFFKILHGIYM